MDTSVVVFCIVFGGSVVLNIVLAYLVSDYRTQRDVAWQDAVLATDEKDKVVQIHHELLQRPIQVLLPQDTIEMLGGAIINYLDSGPSGPTIIYPKKETKN